MTPVRALREERGAIMLIAVFFAVFGVAMLYHAVGIAHAVLFREKLQDASDAAALSAAIMHARAMNLIVLINIVMAAILAVLVTIKLMQALCTIGIAIAAGLAWCTFGATLPAIPPLQSISQTMEEAYQNFHEPIFKALRVLNKTASIISEVTPAAADALSVAEIAATAQLRDLKGAAIGSRMDQLPIENDAFSVLCGKAGQFPVKLAQSMLGPVPGISEVLGLLESPMYDLTSSLSGWFCGDDSSSSSAPVRDYTEPISYPQTELAKACRRSQPENGSTNPADATSPECSESQTDERDAEPDGTTGNCQPGHDCSLGGPYDTHVALARVQCAPTVTPAPVKYFYQLRASIAEYRWNEKQWVRVAVTHGTRSQKASERPPCGRWIFPPSLSTEYNTVVRRSDDVDEVLPVCSDEAQLMSNSWLWEKTEPHFLTITEVSHILGCVRDENVHVDLRGGQPAESSSNDNSPKRTAESAKRWGEDFQVRALLHAKFDAPNADGIVKLSLWKSAAPNPPGAALKPLGEFSVAQAEYYYDGADGRSDWMWNMNWRARLRRFRLPNTAGARVMGAACNVIGGACESIMGQFTDLPDIFAH